MPIPASIVGTLVLGFFALLLAVPVSLGIGWTIHGAIKRRRLIAEALEDHCMLCDSREVTVRGGGRYGCRACGYDSDWADAAATAELVREFQDMRNALTAFREAAEALGRSRAAATRDMFGIGRRGDKYSHLEDAQREVMEGDQLLRVVARRHPELLQEEAPGQELSAELVDADHETRSILGVLLNHGAKRRVRDALAVSCTRLENYVTTVDVMAAVLRDEVIAASKAA